MKPVVGGALMPKFKTWRWDMAVRVGEPLDGEMSRMEANMSCDGIWRRVRFILDRLNSRALDSLF